MGEHFISLDPAMRSGRATINHTRMPAEVLADYVWAGDSAEYVAEVYEVDRADVLVACWYQARWGTRTWRRRWADWLETADEALWHSRYDIPDPPGRADVP